MRGRERLRSLAWLSCLPVFTVVLVANRRWLRLQDTTDGRLFQGVSRNLRCCASLTSPTDQNWIRLSPAETVKVLGRIPVPDIGPVYPTLGALVPLPIDQAYWVINLAFGAAALLLLGMLVRRATHSTVAGLAAQALLLAGPTQNHPFGVIHFANLMGAVLYDVPALALLLAGFWFLSSAVSRRASWLACGLLCAAALTRYALVAVLLAIALVSLVERARSRDRARPVWPSVTAFAVVATWQYLLGPVLLGPAGPKAIGYHRASWRPVVQVVTGWFGLDPLLDVSVVLATVVAVGMLAALIAVVILRPISHPSALMATAAIAVVTMIIAGQTFLVTDIILNDERHFLVARACILGVFAIEGFALARRLVARLADRSPRWRWVTAPLLVGFVAGLMVVGIGTRPWLLSRDMRYTPEIVAEIVARHPDAVVMSNEPTLFYQQFRRPVIDALRPVEQSTGEARSPETELRDLAVALDPDRRSVVVVNYPGTFIFWVDIDDFPCAQVLERSTDESGIEVLAVDLSACAE